MTKLKQQIEEVRAGATRPSCFQDILDLQKKLGKILEPRQTRPRTLTDICLSAIAECIEFNEATKESHKTWKEKPFNELEMKKEAIDILFFFAQLLNNEKTEEGVLEEVEEYFYSNVKEMPFYRIEHSIKECTIRLIRRFGRLAIDYHQKKFSIGDVNFILVELGQIFGFLRMDYEEVLAMYWDKWNENLDRIGEEWN